MEVSALKYSGVGGLHGRSPLLRLQSDERLVALMRRGNHAAFEHLVGRYQTRLLAFCRHMLSSTEDAEDVLQDVFAAAFNAILADDRPINVRPWLYRIARNRSLNHVRRASAIGVDSMDVHFSDHGETTADQVHKREDFRLLLGDIRDLPETQRTALLLREMDALSYVQIAEAMETTIPGVKSLLVRARVSLAEAAEARLLTCAEVRIELGEVAEGLRRRTTPPVRRHLRSCDRCSTFRGQLKETNKALAALLPIGPLVLLRKFVLLHLSHSASAGAGSHATATAAAGTTAAAGSGAAGGTAAATAGGTVAAGGAAGAAGVAGAGAAGAGAAGAGATGAGAAAGGAAAGATGAAGAGAAGAAGASAGAGAAGAAAAGGTTAAAAAGGTVAATSATVAVGSTATSLVSAGVGAVATKAAAGLAAAAIVTAGAVEVDQGNHHHAQVLTGSPVAARVVPASTGPAAHHSPFNRQAIAKKLAEKKAKEKAAALATTTTTATATTPTLVPAPGRTESTTIATTLPSTGEVATKSASSGSETISAPTMTSTAPVSTPTVGSCTTTPAPTPTPGTPSPGSTDPGSTTSTGTTGTGSTPTGSTGSTTTPAATPTTTPATPAPTTVCSATAPGSAPTATPTR